MIRGIDRVDARKLVRTFGDKVFDVIEEEPERLREVTGIEPILSRKPRILGRILGGPIVEGTPVRSSFSDSNTVKAWSRTHC